MKKICIFQKLAKLVLVSFWKMHIFHEGWGCDGHEEGTEGVELGCGFRSQDRVRERVRVQCGCGYRNEVLKSNRYIASSSHIYNYALFLAFSFKIP